MGLDEFKLKVMDEKESSVTCQNDQRILEVSEEWLSCLFGQLASPFIMEFWRSIDWQESKNA